MLCTPQNLANGIQKFIAHRNWRCDFHNRFYANVTDAAKSTANLLSASVGGYVPAGRYGPTIWHDIVFELWFWRAIRPFKMAVFSNHNGLPALQAAYAAIGAGLPYLQVPPSHPPQPQIVNLFNSAAALKPVGNNSPVFPSKCCHMILPWEFPVWDNVFVRDGRQKLLAAIEVMEGIDHQTRQRLTNGINQARPDYWCYRCVLLHEWDTLPVQQQAALTRQLNANIGQNPWQHFPYRTKIPELCLA